MSSVRSFTMLTCQGTECGGALTMHDALGCIHCKAPNNQSGRPPIPRAKPYTRSKAGEQRRIESLRAHHAAKRARNQAMAQRGRT